MIACDTETDGLSPHFNRPLVLGTYKDQSFNIIPLKPDTKINLTQKTVWHNAHFDLGMLSIIPDSPDDFEDTFLLSRIHNHAEDSHSLDACLTRLLHQNPYQDFPKRLLQRADWSNLTDQQRDYLRTDVQFLIPLLESMQESLDHPMYRFDKQSVIAGLKVQQHGLPVLHHAVDEYRDKLTNDLNEILNEELWFNPNSSQQTCKELKISSSGDDILAEMAANGSEYAATVRKARKIKKVIGFLDKLYAHPRYYGTLKPSAKSGRFTSSNENIQQIPRSLKKFIGTGDDMVLISSDYAALEMRTVAVLANDKKMLDLFKHGGDLHDFTAVNLFGEDFTKEDRQVAKTFNFASLYGSGAATIRKILIKTTGIVKTEKEINKLKNKWLSTFSGIKEWQQKGNRRMNKQGHWHTPMGRPYTPKRFTDMLNLENQGFGAEVSRLALHKLLEILPPQAKCINFIHDAVLVECPNDPAIYEPTAQAVVDAMCHGWSAHPTDKRGLTMPVAAGVAHDWATADTEDESKCIYVARGEA